MPLSAKSLVDEALDYLSDEKPLHAIQILRRAILNDPEYGDAYLKLAEIYIGARNYNAAGKILSDGLARITEDHPDISVRNRLVYALGSLYYNLGESERALPLLRMLNSWRNPGVHLALATIFIEMHQYEEALSEVRQVLRVDAKYPDANGLFGKTYLKQKDFPNAIKYLKRELALNESSVEFRLDLATAYYMLGALWDALEEFTLLIDTDPDFFPGWLMCGKILLETGRLSESEFYLSRAESLNPISAEVKHALANLYSALGDVERARGVFDELARTGSLIEDDTEALERLSSTRDPGKRSQSWSGGTGTKASGKKNKR